MDEGHHLILGEMRDFITGQVIADTHDERYRQSLARLLVQNKAFNKNDIEVRKKIEVLADPKLAISYLDFLITIDNKQGMILKYAPGSIVTRHRPALAISRILGPFQIPVVVVTNGIDADVLDGVSGKTIGKGLGAIPDHGQLKNILGQSKMLMVDKQQKSMAHRIIYAYEVDDSCPCDTNICTIV